MPLLTIFSAPKPFTDPHINVIQRNAIRSWLALDDVEALLIGEEPGLAETVAEFGVTQLPDVRRNDWGTPLVSSIFDLARDNSTAPLLCYVNADILLMPGIVEAARRVREQSARFLLVGRRWNLEVTEPLDFSPGWPERLKDQVEEEGELHAPAGSDYFVFPKELFAGMPDFAIGRAGWDNWTIYHARSRGWDTIDATPDVAVVHQNHDYAHLPGGRPHYDQEESQANIRLARGQENAYTGYTLLDTNRELRGGRIVRPPTSLVQTVRRLELAMMPNEKQGPRWELTRRIRRWRRRLTDRK
ncbi:MAG TPA: hypothetical protein VMN57_14090 [Anaerolineales bacterium]|nr:hypothetical protein [Anaerolineales bacterium]